MGGLRADSRIAKAAVPAATGAPPTEDAAGTTASTSAAVEELGFLRCPHCAFEIDPTDLDRLRVDPASIQRTPASWDRVAPRVEDRSPHDACAEVGGSLPPGT